MLRKEALSCPCQLHCLSCSCDSGFSLVSILVFSTSGFFPALTSVPLGLAPGYRLNSMATQFSSFPSGDT